MKRLGLTGTGLLALTALMAANGTVPAGASHPQSLCIDAEPDEYYATSNDDTVDKLLVYRGISDADHPPNAECHSDEGTTGDALEIDFEIEGVADPDSGDSPETPDLTCVIESEDSSCRVRPPKSSGGQQLIAAWVDNDSDNNTVELDRAEGQDEDSTPGDIAEPDNTDVVLWTWTHGDRVAVTVLTIDYIKRKNLFRGAVGARIRACRRGRVVTLKKRRQGKDKVVGRDVSRRSGEWRIDVSTKAKGSFFARASRKAPQNRLVRYCRSDRSPTIRVR